MTVALFSRRGIAIPAVAGALLFTFAVAPPVFASERTVPATTYKMVDLGTLGGGISTAQAINDAGQVVGWSTTKAGTTHAFLWSAGRMLDLGTLGGSQSIAFDINNRSEVTGYSTTASGVDHMFRWSRGRMTDLGPGDALAINDRGQIVGLGMPKPGMWTAVRITGTRVTQLSKFGVSAQYSVANDINASGQIIGSDAGGPYLLTRDRISRFVRTGVQLSTARAINRRGDVVGFGSFNAGDGRALLWTRTKTVNLGLISTPTGMTYSEAFGINDKDQVVGISMTRDGGVHGFVWASGRMTDLGVVATGGMNGSKAYGINNRGLVVGMSDVGHDAFHAIEWVPEHHR